MKKKKKTKKKTNKIEIDDDSDNDNDNDNDNDQEHFKRFLFLLIKNCFEKFFRQCHQTNNFKQSLSFFELNYKETAKNFIADGISFRTEYVNKLQNICNLMQGKSRAFGSNMQLAGQQSYWTKLFDIYENLFVINVEQIFEYF